MTRLKQSVRERNKAKIQKYLFRLKELKPDNVDADIVRAERLLRELTAEEGLTFSGFNEKYDCIKN